MNRNPISKICKTYGLTLYRLAKLSGVSESTLADIVKFDRDLDSVNFGIVRKIAAGINTTLDELILICSEE